MVLKPIFIRAHVVSNNNNNNNQDNVYGAVVMTRESLQEFTRWMQNSTWRLPAFEPSRWTWAI